MSEKLPPTEAELSIESSNICYEVLCMKEKLLEEQGFKGKELALKKAEFLREQADDLLSYRVEMKPGLKEAMIKWYQGAAKHLSEED